MESELEDIILVLSANKVGLDILLTIYGKSLMYNRKNSVLSTEPCDIPFVPVRTTFGVFSVYC